MIMDYKKLFHDEVAFQHETLETRMQNYGFKNMGRMELFLWDLELFLQMQDRLGDRVVLKGGAATQFYLPKEVQRTSVDIDMLFAGTESEIDEVLNQIEAAINLHTTQISRPFLLLLSEMSEIMTRRARN